MKRKNIVQFVLAVWMTANVFAMILIPIYMWLTTPYGVIPPDNPIGWWVLASVLASYVCFKKWG